MSIDPYGKPCSDIGSSVCSQCYNDPAAGHSPEYTSAMQTVATDITDITDMKQKGAGAGGLPRVAYFGQGHHPLHRGAGWQPGDSSSTQSRLYTSLLADIARHIITGARAKAWCLLILSRMNILLYLFYRQG
jgi:hypothetical protein